MAKLKNTPLTLWQTIAVNAAGLLGYALFLFGWLGIFGFIGIGVLQLLPYNPDPAPVEPSPAGVGTPSPILQLSVAVIGVGLSLVLSYFFFIRFGTKVIQALSSWLKTSTWVIKFVGLPLSWLLVAFCVSFVTLEPQIQLAAFAVSLIFSIIGLTSFTLEYLLIRYFRH